MKKITLMAGALFCGFALLAGCSNPVKNQATDEGVSQAQSDTSGYKKEIMAVDREVAESWAKGDSVAIANDYTSDAKFMNSNRPAIIGRKNIQSAFSRLIKLGAGKITFATLGVWGTENGLAEEGAFSLATKDRHLIDKGKYIVLWKKESGKWKIFRDCSNSDMPLASSK